MAEVDVKCFEKDVAQIFGDRVLCMSAFRASKKSSATVVITLDAEDGVTFEELKFLSELFESTHIDMTDFSVTQGCETCGHGGTSTIRVSVRKVSI